MADQIVSWGGFNSKGTSGMGVTGSLAVSGSATITNGATVYNNIQINTSNTPSLSLYDSLQDYSWLVYTNGTNFFIRDNGGNNAFSITPNRNITIGPGTSDAARLTVKGSGTTSSTTSFLVQNSAGTTSLQVTDDRTTFVNGLLNVGTIYSGIECNNLYSAIFQNGGSGGQIRLSMGGTNYLQVNQPKDANSGVISGTINTIITPIGYGWSSGTASPNLLSLNPSINNTGTYSGTFRGIYYNPTLTSLTGTTHIAFENTTGDVLFGTTSGNVGIGTPTPSASLHISGSSNSVLFEIDSPTINNILLVSGSGNVGFSTTPLGYRITAGDPNSGIGGTIAVRAGSSVPMGYKFYQDGLGELASINYEYGDALRINSVNMPIINSTSGTERTRLLANGNFGINESTPTARLQVKGSGTTSSTTALRVENSNATASLLVRDDGRVFIGDPNLTTNWQITPENLIHVTSGGSVANFTLTAGAISFPYSLVHFGGTAAATGGTPTLTTTRTNTASTSLSAVQFNFNITNSTGTSLVHNGLNIVNTINNTDTYSGTVRGIFYNPTLTSVSGTTHRAIETTSGDVVFNGGQVGIGTSSFYSTTKLKVKGADSGLIFLVSGDNYGVRIGASSTGGFIGGVDHTGFGSDEALQFRATKYQFDLGNVLIGTSTDGGARLQVKGSGTTSSTTALLVQNANASASLSVTDDRLVTVSSKLQVGTFTPGVATGSSTIFTTGRISAGGGITLYTPAAGDDNNTGIFYNNGLQIYSQNATVALFRPVGGGNSGFMFNVGGYGYNPPSGTGTVNTVLIDNTIVPTGTNSINYNYVTVAPSITQGSFGTGTIRGFYFAPGINSLNTSPLRAFESTRGDVIVGGNAVVAITGSLAVTGSVIISESDITTAWTSYTPTWTSDGTAPSLGNGTLTGAYKVIGKTCFVRVRLAYGSSTTSGTGAFYFDLPFSASAASGVQFPCSILDNGNAWYQATVNGEYGGFTNKTAIIGQSSGANSSQGITGTFPFTFGTSDSIQFNGSYEIA